MKSFSGILLFCISSFSPLLAQFTSDLDNLQKHYESFEFTTVISKSENLLLDKDRFSDQALIEIYNLKAASHFAIGDRTNTRKTFVEVMKLDMDYKINNITYSPKLVDFFNEVKKEFSDILKVKKETSEQKKEIIKNDNLEHLKFDYGEINSAIAKSLLVPGWGHFHIENNTKGWLLTSASSVSLVSMVYFIFDTNSKERNYLTETSPHLIQAKYDDYNESYIIRNALIVTYTVIWLYSQIDLLFFSEDLGSKNITLHSPINIQPINQENITISFKFPF